MITFINGNTYHSITRFNTAKNPIFTSPYSYVPSYQPLVVPPQDLRRPEGTKEVQTTENPPQRYTFHPYLVSLYHRKKSSCCIGYCCNCRSSCDCDTTVINALKDKIQKFLQGKINKWKQTARKERHPQKIKENVDDHDEQMQILEPWCV